MYLVLARKYRPKNFDEVWGQKHITEALKKAIKEGRTAHAYLFAGPRGTGKTSVARVFARALNCEKGPTLTPCDRCEICRTITAGSSMDVLEIDAASNRGIDEIRNLRENVNLTPSNARFKIYIIDEVHMLTEPAWNALLKTLEEPPDYVKFFLATTTPEKIPPTIISRCQRFNFKPFKIEELVEKLKEICKKEGFTIEEPVLKEIYEFSGGSMRDALSILDQLIVNAENNNISYQSVKEFLGLVEEKSIGELLTLVREQNVKKLLSLFHALLSEGKDPAIILEGIIKKFKGIILGRIEDGGNVISEEDKRLYLSFNEVDTETLLNAVSTVIEYKNRLYMENIPVVLSEILLIKLAHMLGDKTTLQQKKIERGDEVLSEKKPSIKEESIFSQGKTEKEKPHSEKEVKAKGEKIPLKSEEEVLSHWKVILSEIKKARPTLEAALREGTPIKFKDNTLFISFSKKYEFHKSLIENQHNNIKTIEDALAKITGIKDIKVSLLSEGKQESPLDNGEIKKIVDFFGGEIINVEE
ncbi:MAG TPA: DNA polymerase III subunit gamma/tau [bacterium]|nr:DNA polymerase III subunit gamma/tau [bacterium]